MPGFTLLLIVSTVVDALVALVVLLLLIRRRRRSGARQRVTLLEVAGPAIAAAAGFVLKLPLLRVLGVGFFGVFHLIYLDLALVVPMLGVVVLVLTRVGLPRLGRFGVGPGVTAVAGLAVAAGPLAAYATFVEPRWLQVEETTIRIDGLDPADGKVTVAVLADLQFARVTEYERGAVRRAVDRQPDIIVLPGDVFQGPEAAFERNLGDLRALLGSLHAPGGVYLVEGNVDTPGRLRRSVEGTDVRFLHNEVVEVEVGGLRVAIGGVGWDFAAPEAVGMIQQLARRETADLRLVIAHSPDIVLTMEEGTGVDLIIAGHTHGGQVQIPGIGPLLSLSHVPRRVAAGGLTILNGTRLYVSRGVGCERGQAPLLRFCCRPELSLLELASQ